MTLNSARLIGDGLRQRRSHRQLDCVVVHIEQSDRCVSVCLDNN